ncbi:hypothetical protein ACTHQ2_22580 [Bacillus subtilis]|uniref:hypothetical protein n=1 Tax=Bacillus subtilis TaxID=1423 RepID=UPI003F7C8332
MSNPNKEKAPIVVQITPEMANWMHPQTKERRQRILARAEATTQRYHRQRLEAAKQRSRTKKRIALIIGESSVFEAANIVVKASKRIPRKKVLGHINQSYEKLLHRVDK